MTDRLAGKVALITGAASGIGAETARLFVSQGAKVMLTDINIDAGQRLADELDCAFTATDVSDEAQVQRAVERTVQRHGRLDCMINNAGMIGVVGSILDTSAADWQRTLDVLLNSVFYGIKHAGRQMRAQGDGGVILSLSSLAGLLGGMGPHVYSVAKHGVIALTRGAASELAQYGIRVNAVAPGVAVTPLIDQVYGSRDASIQAAGNVSPLGTPMLAQEIAASLLYLASEEARHISAHTLVLDSGVSNAGGSAAQLFHSRESGFIGRLPAIEPNV
jgi:NAD(P)-dependent dehydrogenase (short-subunit alcohol dehydrogenase family)